MRNIPRRKRLKWYQMRIKPDAYGRLKFLFALALIAVIIITAAVFIMKRSNVLPAKNYSNADFGIETFISPNDADADGIDDQTDILQSARAYIETKPKYKSVYYATGYPDDGYGVCTDVVAFALKGAGYDLMTLVNRHIKANPEKYNIEAVDINIDFRRVRNLRVFFDDTAESLTTDINQIEQWQGGDIVIFPGHIGIVSDKRNKNGVAYLIHNGGQPNYEEDALGHFEVLAHYRIK